MTSISIVVAIKFVVLFGGLLWFGWSQSRVMARSLAAEKRKAAEAEAGAAKALDAPARA